MSIKTSFLYGFDEPNQIISPLKIVLHVTPLKKNQNLKLTKHQTKIETTESKLGTLPGEGS